MHLRKEDLKALGKVKRLNIINAISGIKPANLIGSISAKKVPNLAIFSSVIHLGSNPGLLGFISRPAGNVHRHTLENIKETGSYTINHVHESFIEQAHYTSAKFDRHESEFEKCGFTEEYIENFQAPYVQESQLKIGMKFLEIVPIKVNNTVLVIGEINHIILPDAVINEEGYIDMEALSTVGISGLNNYYQLQKIGSFPYARTSEVPDFLEK
ncbi:flavin reductase family protein [Portibacter lacus]|uniref:Flavin oxidoreductase n=1 Tax=Portibacter lacus TaxID=1099794 RepID=A0AA37STI8_9BACT|nr:flavin reductase [Portibacter lacus]GLR19942.1 flavin oxidoreductase [Portibacter lacus]